MDLYHLEAVQPPPASPTSPPSPVSELMTSYAELNSSTIDTFTQVPTALEFMRYVARNRPFIVAQGAAHWQATRQWNVATLKELMAGQKVNVAVTPDGRADAPTQDGQNGDLLFVRPWEELQDFGDFIDHLVTQECEGGNDGVKDKGEEVRYAQTQNDNLRNEYATLFSHVEKDIPWARIALQNEPEAINLWIGNSSSVTCLHKDNYENIYVQIRGQKHFVLLPPVAQACVAEQNLSPASYCRDEQSRLKIRRDAGDKVPFATWDPDERSTSAYKHSNFLVPLRLTLNEGDMLYLPALWFHKVTQSCNKEGICCAVNYWYDMDFTGAFYPSCNFIRDVVQRGLGVIR